MRKFYDLYIITSYNQLYLLDRLKNSSIQIRNFCQKDEYTFTFESSFINRRKIKKLFPYARIIKSKGIFTFFRFLIVEKITLISIIVASCFFFFLSTKIWKIKIRGNYEIINENILEELETFKIKQGSEKPTFAKLKQIENDIYENMENDIEWLEFSLSGSVLYINYIKRRIAPEIVETKGKLYASKDGIISKIDVLKGNVLVKENQYVRKGDLLVDDYLINSNNEEVYLGTSGNVYAYTWYLVDLSYQTSLNDDIDIFLEAMEKAFKEIENKLSPNASVFKENILQYKQKDNIISIKIHFTFIEMIGEEV